MALFSKKTEKKTSAAAVKKESPKRAGAPSVSQYDARTIVQPRVTEKATLSSESGVYVFEIADSATKHEVQEAMRALYKVTPRKVNIVRLPRTNAFIRGKRGVRPGVKKAYVYLRKGETIEIS